LVVKEFSQDKGSRPGSAKCYKTISSNYIIHAYLDVLISCLTRPA